MHYEYKGNSYTTQPQSEIDDIKKDLKSSTEKNKSMWNSWKNLANSRDRSVFCIY